MAVALFAGFLGVSLTAGARRRRRRRHRAAELRGSRVFFGDRWWSARDLSARVERETGIRFDRGEIEAALDRDGIDAVVPYFKALLEVLIAENVRYLEEHPRTPGLYDAGIRYQMERGGRERWQNIRALYRTKRGDCEDLVGTRLAELEVARQPARSRWTRQTLRDGRTLFHVTVLHDNGTIEDPSLLLGMREAA